MTNELQRKVDRAVKRYGLLARLRRNTASRWRYVTAAARTLT